MACKGVRAVDQDENYNPIGRDGEIIDRAELRPLTRRVLGVPARRLRELSTAYGRLVIAVAGGTDKREAILGAMRGRFANVLVTDEETATALLNSEGGSASLSKPPPEK